MTRLFSWLLNAGYLLVILLAAPWILWAAWRHGKYLAGFAEKLWGQVPERAGNRRCIWLHAVSVGEVNLLATTLAELERQQPDLELVISTTTKTGYELATRKYPEHTVFYCPLDFSWAVQRALRRIRPDLLVLAELELWPNLIRAAQQHGVRVAIVNGRLSDRSFRGYRRLGPLVGRLLSNIDLIAAQDEVTADRFRQLGAPAERVVCTGSLKFDGAETDRGNRHTQRLRALASFAADDLVWVAGSTQAPEEQYALEIFQALAAKHPCLRLVLVPRHPQRFEEVARLLDAAGVAWQRRSALSDAALRMPNCSILLVDTIGELAAWWGTATLGFVGGSFGSRGGQNMLEPAAYGVATCFGPQTRNFRDIVARLLAVDGAVVVDDRQSLQRFVQRMLDHPAAAEAMGQRARQLVQQQQGATQRTVALLLPLIGEEATPTKSAA